MLNSYLAKRFLIKQVNDRLNVHKYIMQNIIEEQKGISTHGRLNIEYLVSEISYNSYEEILVALKGLKRSDDSYAEILLTLKGSKIKESLPLAFWIASYKKAYQKNTFMEEFEKTEQQREGISAEELIKLKSYTISAKIVLQWHEELHSIFTKKYYGLNGALKPV